MTEQETPAGYVALGEIGAPEGNEPLLIIQNEDGVLLAVEPLGFNSIRIVTPKPDLQLTAFDTWRVIRALEACLMSLPLDMHRPGPA